MAWPMLFHSIRSWLLGLVLATVIPLVTVIGVGLGSQFRDDQNEAMERALDEAKLLAAQVDDHVSKISTRLADTNANDALLRQVKEELPAIFCCSHRMAATLASPGPEMSGSMPAVALISRRSWPASGSPSAT